MPLKVAKTLWGVPEADDPAAWDSLFARIKAEGFDAVEAITLVWRKDPKLFKSLLEKHGLALICQIHTTGGDVDPKTNEYRYCTSNKLHDHLGSFVKLAAEAASLGPVLINSHSGHDSWGSGDKAVSFFKHALKVEAQLGVPVVHETHRQRLLYSPYSAAELLAHPDLAKLRINADLSHWCCVCEHVFDATDPRDDFWPSTLAAVAAHCEFVHCRVGHAEGPQVSDPSAPEFGSELEAHCSWWRQIWAAQAGRHGEEATLWAEPEHGPPPYLATLPYTQAPVSDLWDINKRMAARMRTEFASAMKDAATAAAEAAAAEAAAASKAPASAEGKSFTESYTFGKYGMAKVVAPPSATPPGAAPAGGGSFLAGALEREAAAKEDAKEAAKAAKAREKLLKAVVKEGGKKGVEIEGASDMGGLEFFCTTIETPEGDTELLQAAMAAMNAQPDPEAEDRKGCSGHVGKMIFSAGVDQLAMVAYVPEDKAAKIDVAEWMRAVLEGVGGKVMMGPPKPAVSPQGGSVVEAVVAAQPDEGHFPIKDKDLAMAAAFTFLRSKGAFPDDEDEDEDDVCFGDDAFDNIDDL